MTSIIDLLEAVHLDLISKAVVRGDAIRAYNNNSSPDLQATLHADVVKAREQQMLVRDEYVQLKWAVDESRTQSVVKFLEIE